MVCWKILEASVFWQLGLFHRIIERMTKCGTFPVATTRCSGKDACESACGASASQFRAVREEKRGFSDTFVPFGSMLKGFRRSIA
jgi:hypothetical protein